MPTSLQTLHVDLSAPPERRWAGTSRFRAEAQRLTDSYLRDLGEKGVVVREVVPSSPPSVEYSLSELGRELIPVIHTIVRVGTRIREGSLRKRTAAAR